MSSHNNIRKYTAIKIQCVIIWNSKTFLSYKQMHKVGWRHHPNMKNLDRTNFIVNVRTIRHDRRCICIWVYDLYVKSVSIHISRSFVLHEERRGSFGRIKQIRRTIPDNVDGSWIAETDDPGRKMEKEDTEETFADLPKKSKITN